MLLVSSRLTGQQMLSVADLTGGIVVIGLLESAVGPSGRERAPEELQF